MLIELNGTPLINGRHSGGASETAVLVLQPDQSRAESLRQAPQNVAEVLAEEVVQEEQQQEQEPGIVASSLEHHIQARLLVVDKRLHQAMYNSS